MTNFIIPPPPGKELLTPKQLHEYQKECVLHMLYNQDAMLWLQMGLGKTIITLTSIVDLMKAGKVRKTVIFGPIRVIEAVWEREARKWSHTNNLTFSIIRGVPEKRTRALFRKSDIYLINYELMNWFAEILEHYYKDDELPFDCVVYDEISKLKSSTSLRIAGGKRDRIDKNGKEHSVKIIGWRKMINKFKYRYGLTGTPAPNGYLDLHGQFLAVDGGKRLGTHITHYKSSYFKPNFNGFGVQIASDYHQSCIESKISDITVKMDAKDYLDIPEIKITNIMVNLPDKARTAYQQIEKEMFTELESGTEIEVFNSASKSNKCLQFCNGSPYTNLETREWEKIHDVKLNALEDVLEEAGGSPVLCSYTFISDAERIMKHFKKYKPVNLTSEKSSKTKSIIEKWNKGKIKLLIGHPASMGHGIDGLQDNGSIVVWFGLNWSLELYEQMNGRIHRQGQKKPVSIIRILCKDTVDLAVLDAIERKESSQEGLKKAINRYKLKTSY